MYSWSSSCPSFAGNDGDNDGYSRYDNGTCGAWGRRQENTKSTKQRISLDKIPKLLSYLARNLRQITRNTLKKTHFDMRLEHCLHFLGAPPEDVDVP